MSNLVLILLIILLIPVSVLCILSPGTVKPITDEQGNVIENSISEKTFVEINGVEWG